MNKSYHFISGLPRSGSTLLSTILNQNPNFYADISNPLARFVRSIITESFAGPGYKLQCPEEKRIKLIQSLIDTYHYDKDKPVCFNTNRGWTALVDVLAVSHPNSKIICCVRDINWILDSFELLFRKNPFTVSSMYSNQEAETVYSRCDALMTPGHTLRFAYDCIKEAITGNNKHKLILVEYDQLAKNPESIMQALYKFIDQPYYDHDFDNVEASWDEYDVEANINGLHKIRKQIKYIERKSILPPDIWNNYSNLEVWR
jgi:sulfotransferase